MKTLINTIVHYLVFFAVISFVVTCSFLVFFSSVTLSEADVRAFAPIVFFNVFVLAGLFTLSDLIRRRITVDRPARIIQQVLHRLASGDFTARVQLPRGIYKEARFRDIADSINLLASELASVETLRSDFIANVSHELKTPLAVIQNYGTMLQKAGGDERLCVEYATAITDTSRRLAALISNILKLNKLENQQIFPEAGEFDLGEQLCECILQFEDVWEQKGIEIETDIQDGVTIRSDSELLSLVWNNLISNALKFTQSGGRVRIALAATDNHVRVTVADNGCGIKPEVGAHIFEKFYQGDTSHGAQGNGLGLALVKRVVDILHGEVTVESVYGKGSTFTVSLRRAQHGHY